MTAITGWVSDWQVAEWISTLGESWASLHYSEPLQGSPTSSELAGASYTRVLVSFTQSGPRVMSTASPLTWYGLSESTITHVGLFATSTGSALRCVIPLDSAVTVAEGDAYTIPGGDLHWVW